MKFLANENIPLPSIGILRNEGYDVLSIAESFAGIKDVDVIDIASAEGRIILTFDKDYGELIFRYGAISPPSVVFFRNKGSDTHFVGKTILDLLKTEKVVLDGHFTIVEQSNVRQRKYR